MVTDKRIRITNKRAMEHRIYHKYLVRFSLQNCVFIPHTLKSTVSWQRVLQSLVRVRFQQYRGSASCNSWQGSASNDYVHVDLASVPQDLSSRARVGLHARTVKHLTMDTYQQCSSFEYQYINPWYGSASTIAFTSMISQQRVMRSLLRMRFDSIATARHAIPDKGEYLTVSR